MISLILLILSVSIVNGDVQFSDRSRNFSIELLHHTAEETNGHVVISPFGIWTLMTGVALGTSGNSYEQLRNTFILPRNEQALINGYKNLTNQVLKSNAPGVSLTSKNYMFLDDDFYINPNFRKAIVNDFEAVIKVIDFKDAAAAARTANNYIANTGAKVSNVLTSEDFLESRMLLTNVISFKGLWGLPFNASETAVESFYDEKGQIIGEVKMMYQRGQFPYSNVNQVGALVLEMPYGINGQYCMLILLPVPGRTIKDVYFNLEKVSLQSIFDKLDADTQEYGLEEVDVKIPRFKISTNVVLNRPLNNMGVYDIFDPDTANFARATKDDIFVSAIVHKADIEVTESGTVASASTTANFADRITTPSYSANRPFIYFVLEKSTTTVIFGGIYSKPSIY